LAIGDFPNGAGVDGLAFATGGGDPFWGDVPWVTAVPTAGVTLADSESVVDVAIDTTGLVEDECYAAGLGLLHNDPGQAIPAMVPLSLCVRSAWPVFYLDKTVSAIEVNAGEVATYTLVYGNYGSLETGITISDVLPFGVTYSWSDPAGSYEIDRHEVAWPNLTLDHGSRITTTIVVTVNEGMIPGTWFTNTAHLIWRDQVMASNWANSVVAGEPPFDIFLPFVAHDLDKAYTSQWSIGWLIQALSGLVFRS
jgi:uncharacterized repeat protein (TIGR01451 family)